MSEGAAAALNGRGLSTATRGWLSEDLRDETIAELAELGRQCRGNILRMTELANSGHPGGSCSSIDLYLVLYAFADIDPSRPRHPDRDRIVVSHGHTSPGVYSALGALGFFDSAEAVATFRKCGSRFEGHVERAVPGVEWSTGNLGQGLSAGCGMALAARLTGGGWHTFVVMSDGEQHKGQVAEARRFAAKYRLADLTVLIDANGLQMSGPTAQIMPTNIRADFEADGWVVLECDGHDYQDIYRAVCAAVTTSDTPVAIIAHTIMGKGVAGIEGDYRYHGMALSPSAYERAMGDLGLAADLSSYRTRREQFKPQAKVRLPDEELSPALEVGAARTYEPGTELENRAAWGRTLADLAEANRDAGTLLAVVDCDVMESTRVAGFAELMPERFFQAGISEHSAAALAGALSTQGVVTFFSDFGVFGLDEAYNQQRLNAVNVTNLKTVLTHAGIDVGEDGKTHHCVDYLSLTRALPGAKVIVPADANQTDRAVRWAANESGNIFIVLGRSKLPVIVTEGGAPRFADNYEFSYGAADVVREGDAATIVTYGSMLHRAVAAWEKLSAAGRRVRVLNVPCPCALSDEDMAWAAEPGVVVTYEDHLVDVGLGACVALRLADVGMAARLVRIGLSGFAGSGSAEELFAAQHLDVESLAFAVTQAIGG